MLANIRINLVFFGVWLLLLAGCAAPQPRLSIAEPVWNVGQIVAGVNHTRNLTVENAGNEPLVFDKIEQCCGFFGSLEKTTLLPGEKTTLSLRLKPVKMIGDLQAEIFLQSNDPRRPRFPVTAVGSVIPLRHSLAELVTALEYVDLGVMLPGEAVPFSVRIKNGGNEPLRMVSTEKSKFVVEKGTQLLIPPNGEGDVTFEYRAERTGPIDEKVTLVSNDTLGRTLEVEIKGYVAQDWVPDRAVVIYPVGMPGRYDPAARIYRHELKVRNNGDETINLRGVECSLPEANCQGTGGIEPRKEGQILISYPLETLLRGGQSSQEIRLNLSLPLPVR